MRTLLLVMNPRHIPECVASIEALPIDQAWLTGYREQDLPINRVITETRYDAYSIVSDDAVVSADALARVLSVAELQGRHHCTTGYSNLAAGDDRVNLVDQPLGGPEPWPSSYSLVKQEWVDARGPVFRTWFAGYALTTMSRDRWLECPHPGRENANDYYHSRAMAEYGIPIYAAKYGRIEAGQGA